MIKIDETPIIGRIIQNKYCSEIIVTNYEKLPVEFIEFMAKLAFVINSITYYPDLVCVISNDNLDEFVDKLVRVSSFCKIENGVVK